MRCNHCGQPMNMGEKFCTYCGQSNLSLSSEQTGAPAKAHSTKLWAGIAIAVLVVAAVAFWFRQNGYKRTVENYFKAYETQDGGYVICC